LPLASHANVVRRAVGVKYALMRSLVLIVVACTCAAGASALPPVAEFPLWAYGVTEPPPPAGTAPPAPAQAGRGGGGSAAADPTVHRVPGSAQQFTRAQISNAYGPADWFPEDHPQMPAIVAKGDQARNIAACSLCHMPNGKGRPENAPVAGYPVEYFVKTMMDFKNDLRKSADPRKANTNRMIAFAKAMSDDEIREAATYFAAMPWTQWIRVVEVNVVPKTRIQGGMFLRLEGNDTEPIGNRIIEAPEHTERTELLRDPRAGFVAYVPSGSIARGQALVTTGNRGKTIACDVCHGANLQGMGPVPGIGGRSPSFLVRQMFDMQTGARRGSWTELMKPVVEKLTAEDFVAIAAYVASRPQAAAPGASTAAR
jgi:cytochrome c553